MIENYEVEIENEAMDLRHGYCLLERAGRLKRGFLSAGTGEATRCSSTFWLSAPTTTMRITIWVH
jgi:hypothetical protein